MANNAYGKKAWLIADGFWHSKSNGLFPSHEAICIVNTSDRDAKLKITLFFEDENELGGFTAFCGSRRTNHIRMDKLINSTSKPIPIDKPYAMLIESDTEIVIQYSRMDTSQAEMALMTTIAYPID